MARNTNRNPNRFSKSNQPIVCRECGKRTTDRAGGADMCRSCYDDAGDELTHQDTHTAAHKVEGCKWCNPA